jgi:hypothetical protein
MRGEVKKNNERERERKRKGERADETEHIVNSINSSSSLAVGQPPMDRCFLTTWLTKGFRLYTPYFYCHEPCKMKGKLFYIYLEPKRGLLLPKTY